jgi:hypothetical protein
MDEENSKQSISSEDKIKSLLQLKAKLEQEIRAHTRKIEELKEECDLKRHWIYHLDNMLSEASFQPASALLGSFDSEAEYIATDEPAEVISDEPIDFSGPINITHPDSNELLATINMLEGTILVAFSDTVEVYQDNEIFMKFFQKKILRQFEDEGARIFYEKDDDGMFLRSITIMGTFPMELKSKIVKGLKYSLLKIVDSS